MALIRGNSTLSRLIATHRLLLSKPDGGLRPILISCLVRKLIHGAVTRVLSRDIQPLIGHVQYGCGRSNGAASLYADLLNAQLSSDSDDLVVAKLDISNAFGHASRAAVLKVLGSRIPSSHTWLGWLHEMLATPMRVPLGMSHTEPLFIWEGLPQGDPLSSLLFCSYISFVLVDAVDSLQSSLTPRAYVDDSLLTGSASEMARCLPNIVNALADAGLPVNASKTALWSPNPCVIASYPSLTTFHHACDGLIVCGSPFAAICDDTLPFGSSDFVQQWLQDRLQRERQECKRLLSLHQPALGEYGVQASWQFFRTLYPSPNHPYPA